MRQRKYLEIMIHFFSWIIYISLPFFISPESGPIIKPNTLFLKIHFLGSLLSILIFYSNYLWAIPILLFNKKKLGYLIFLSLLLTLSLVIGNFFISLIASYHPYFDKHPGFYLGFYLRLFFVFSISWALQLFKRFKKIETKTNDAELSSLKAQINPHFLFNTLNGIYAQAITKSEHTADSIQKLSSIMRYVITETNQQWVSIEKEINYISNYIELQKLRLTDKTRVNFTIDGNIEKQKIAPLILICFIENAFKYGVSNEIDTSISVFLIVLDDELKLVVENEKIPFKNNSIESDKIGLTNTIKRLDLLHRNIYTLSIEDDETKYKINLKIPLK